MMFGFKRHALREIAIRNRAEHAAGFRHREHEIVDQLIDRVYTPSPRTLEPINAGAFGDQPFTAHRLTHAREFKVHALVSFDAFIERLSDRALDAYMVVRKTNGKVTVTKSANRTEKVEG